MEGGDMEGGGGVSKGRKGLWDGPGGQKGFWEEEGKVEGSATWPPAILAPDYAVGTILNANHAVIAILGMGRSACKIGETATGLKGCREGTLSACTQLPEPGY